MISQSVDAASARIVRAGIVRLTDAALRFLARLLRHLILARTRP